MSDEEIRRLERAYRSEESPAAAAAWLAARVRAEALHPQRLDWIASAPCDVPWREAARAAGATPLLGEGYRFWARDLMEATLTPCQRRHFALDCAERVLPFLEGEVSAERLAQVLAQARDRAQGAEVAGFEELRAALDEELARLVQARTGRSAPAEAAMSLRDALRILDSEHLDSSAGHRAAAARWSAENPGLAPEGSPYLLQEISQEEEAWQVQRLCAYVLGEVEVEVADTPELAAPAPPQAKTLHTAVVYLGFDDLRRLLASGVDVNALNRRGKTPLHSVIRSEEEDQREEALRILCAAGPDLGARDDDDLTALHTAVSDGRLEFARILLEAGADPNALRESDAVTPLKFAIRHPELVQLLLAAGADPEFPPEAPQSALMLAARAGRLPTVRLLLEAGADPARRCGLSWAEGDTAADLAAKEGTPSVEAFLRRALEPPTPRRDEAIGAGSLEEELERLRGRGQAAEAEALGQAAAWPDLSYLETRRYPGGAEVARFEHAQTGLVFALIPAGRLELPPSERALATTSLLASIFDDEVAEGMTEEGPHLPRPLAVAAPFLLAETPLTGEHWVRAGLDSASPDTLEGVMVPSGERAREPVRGVSYELAEALAASQECRLPTASEWEFAARAGHLHDEDLAQLAERARYDALTPGLAGALLPNGHGLFDMIGNVSEWVSDLGPDAESAEPGEGALYGGDWQSVPWSASEVRFVPRDRAEPRAGLRLARSLTREE